MNKFSKYLATAGIASILGVSAVASADTDLTMYYPVAVGGALTKIVDGMVEDFESQNPDINVNAIYAGNYNDARVKALAALQSGDPAQLSVMFSIDIHALRNLDAIVAFDDIVSTDAERKWLDSFYPALMENGKADGKTWGVPFQRSTIVMYYNKDMFRAAGLDPEKPPTTWAEFAEMGKKLVKKDSSGNVEQWGAMIPSTGYPYWMFGALTKQNSEVLMNQAGTETYFDNPGVIEALEYWQDLGNKHNIMPSGVIEWGTLRQNFLDGKTAIMWHSTGNLTTVKNKASFDFGVAKLPGNKELGSPTGGVNF
jgi:sn-glycerol 3-phosphate transport system substrate-binding protein